MHVVVDFRFSPEEARSLWTREAVRRYLAGTVDATGLTRFGPEVVEENGEILVGFQMIAESHVSIHLDRGTGCGWADVFSCGPVSAGKVSLVIDETLGGPWQSVYGLPRCELGKEAER